VCAVGARADDNILSVAPAASSAAAEETKQDDRILGVIPNYQTVSDPNRPFEPLTAKQKWSLFARSTTDPFVFANVILGAAMSHMRRGIPDYGTGAASFSQRLGAAYADVTVQGMMTGAVFAQVLHQDPRYYRRGEKSGILSRIAYSVSRVAVTRSDTGQDAPNWSFMLGTASAIGMSNAYYPAASRNGSVMLSRIGSTVIGSALGNLLPEFWPDVQRRVFHRHHEPDLVHIRDASAHVRPGD